MTRSVLTLNGGSSSIKFALFGATEPGAEGGRPQRTFSGTIERIGLAEPILTVREAAGETLECRAIAASDHAQAAAQLMGWLEGHTVLDLPGSDAIAAVGHRVVHGGSRYTATTRISEEVLDGLRALAPLAPAHLPGEIALIEAMRERCPALPQLACFDTAFHRELPAVAHVLPVPRRLQASGVRRYGFHGLSYEYLMEELARVAGGAAAQGRVILAHLGAGASLAAVRGGRCLDTTMAFTPTAGLVMGTRTGDLDPGLLVHLLRTEGLTADALDDLVNRRSGLLGLSETSSDVRDLLARQSADPRAAEAVSVFCYQAKKGIGAFAAALGGLDTLVFSAGIGENCAAVRARICEGLGFLGVALDGDRNEANAPVITADDSRVTARVIRTDEEAMIATEVFRSLPEAQGPPSDGNLSDGTHTESTR